LSEGGGRTDQRGLASSLFFCGCHQSSSNSNQQLFVEQANLAESRSGGEQKEGSGELGKVVVGIAEHVRSIPKYCLLPRTNTEFQYFFLWIMTSLMMDTTVCNRKVSECTFWFAVRRLAEFARRGIVFGPKLSKLLDWLKQAHSQTVTC
jgi:hypothetical protein